MSRYCSSGTYSFYYDMVTVWVQGAIASGIVYGGVTILSFFCFQLLWRNQEISPHRTKIRALIIYVSLMFFLSTLMLGSNLNTLFHGVKLPWCNSETTSLGVINSLGRLGDACYVISNWGADALLIWRCLVLYKGSRIPRWIVAFIPTILFLGSIGTGIMFLCFPHGTGDILQARKTGDPENVQSIHACVTLALNISVTFIVVSRLLLYRHRIVRLLGEKHGSSYTGVITMIVESQLIIVIFGMVLVVEIFTEGVPSGGTALAYNIVSQVQILAPLLIIFRVAQGKAWSSKTYGEVTSAATGSDSGQKKEALSVIQFGSTVDDGSLSDTIFQKEQASRASSVQV